MKTYSIKPSHITRKWYIVDASEVPLGRLATQIATLLTGKGKPQFSHHIDCGDYVIVINAATVMTTGNKRASKTYYRHSGFPSGLTATTLNEQLAKDPTIPVLKAVRGMLPVNKLRAERLKRLKIYATDTHNHEAQNPQKLSMKAGK